MTKTLVVNARWEIVNGTPSLLAWAPTGAQEMVNGKLVNGKCEMKSYLKSEMARAAGVSYSTFHRWMKQQSEQLSQWGVTPRTQLLPPVAVKWICGQYGIDEEELWRGEQERHIDSSLRHNATTPQRIIKVFSIQNKVAVEFYYYIYIYI